MGKAARLRAERREERASGKDRAITVLRELYRDITKLTYESPRTCWQYMLEIMAEASGVNCLLGGALTEGSAKVMVSLKNLDMRLKEYFESWQRELGHAAVDGSPISDPIGQILEENEATNQNMQQFFTPLTVVRLLNQINFMEQNDSLLPRDIKGYDPCCGSGRFAMDALIHNKNLTMYNVDLDLWMVRAALLNFRFMGPHTMLQFFENPVDEIGLFDDSTEKALRERGIEIPRSEGSGLSIMGGRARIIQADALIVDIDEPTTWRYSWSWSPPPWQETLKMAGYDGTYNEWLASRPKKEVERKLEQLQAPKPEPRFDFKLDDQKLVQEAARGQGIRGTTRRR